MNLGSTTLGGVTLQDLSTSFIRENIARKEAMELVKKWLGIEISSSVFDWLLDKRKQDTLLYSYKTSHRYYNPTKT